MIENSKLFRVAVTAIIRKNNKYLICKRHSNEKVFPNKWCVPGGKLETKDFVNLPKDTNDHWFDVVGKGLIREVKEETNLEIENIGYVSNLAFFAGEIPVLIFSMYADYKSGEVKLEDEALTDYAWISIDELRNYDLIENIDSQIIEADKMFSRELKKVKN